MQLESRHNIAKYIMAFGSVQGLNIAIGIVRTKLVALLLGPNGMGIMALYSSAIQMMQNLTNLGLDKSGVPTLSKAFATENQFTQPTTTIPNDIICQFRSLCAIAAFIALAFGVLFSWLLSLLVFRSLDHTFHFIVVSPAVPLLIIASGELVILKAARHLKTVATLSLWNVALALVISVPLFYIWGARAIIPMLVITALSQMIITLIYSYKRYPLYINISRATIHHSRPLLRLGMAFVGASGMTSGAEFLIRTIIYNVGDEYDVGLYNIAYMIALTYGGMIFASLDSEYYSRLCQIDRNNVTLITATIHRQIKVSFMFIVPMIVVLEFLLPWIVPLLSSDRFIDAIPMAQITLFALLFRAAYLPVGYVPLSRGDSRTFLLMESLSAIMMLTCVSTGYYLHGLNGAGIGLVLSNAFDLLCYVIICNRKYHLSIL